MPDHRHTLRSLGDLMGRNYPVKDYNNVPRKVFDKHIDRVELRRQRDRQDHRADMQALIQKLENLEKKVTHLEELMNEYHPVSDLEQLPDGRWRRKHGTEGL